MDAEKKERKIRTGVKQGGGSPPGYLWSVLFFAEASREAAAILNSVQYAHAALQFQELARSLNPRKSNTVDVRSIEDYYELRDKGGVLGKINLRVYFHVDKHTRSIVVLGVDKKEEDGQTSQAIKIKMRYRRRRYCAMLDQ